jgi:hypothetical protein
MLRDPAGPSVGDRGQAHSPARSRQCRVRALRSTSPQNADSPTTAWRFRPTTHLITIAGRSGSVSAASAQLQYLPAGNSGHHPQAGPRRPHRWHGTNPASGSTRARHNCPARPRPWLARVWRSAAPQSFFRSPVNSACSASTLPELVAAVTDLAVDVVLDGEIVIWKNTRVQRLRQQQHPPARERPRHHSYDRLCLSRLPMPGESLCAQGRCHSTGNVPARVDSVPCPNVRA